MSVSVTTLRVLGMLSLEHRWILILADVYDSLRQNPLALSQKRLLMQMETRYSNRVRRNADTLGEVRNR